MQKNKVNLKDLSVVVRTSENNENYLYGWNMFGTLPCEVSNTHKDLDDSTESNLIQLKMLCYILLLSFKETNIFAKDTFVMINKFGMFLRKGADLTPSQMQLMFNIKAILSWYNFYGIEFYQDRCLLHSEIEGSEITQQVAFLINPSNFNKFIIAAPEKNKGVIAYE